MRLSCFDNAIARRLWPIITRPVPRHVAAVLVFATLAGPAWAYDPPEKSAELLKGVDFSSAVPLDESYRLEFAACDGKQVGQGKKDHFLGENLKLPNVSDQKYLCSEDPNNVEALLKLSDGAIYWHSKMALDVDGSWAAWNDLPGATDLKQTSYKWPGSSDPDAQSAQIDPDQIPFIVIPMDGKRDITGDKSRALGQMFAKKTGLKLGDMGVVVFNDRWTPALIGDGGPFMRLGEGSHRVFEAVGRSRCKKWSPNGLTCFGPGKVNPYRNVGESRDVIFIAYPGTGRNDITPDNAILKLCVFAREKLGLKGGDVCSPYGRCKFDAETMAFAGTPAEQASCLLRKVNPFGKVDASPAKLPVNLSRLIGQPVGISKPKLRQALSALGLSEAALGGSLDYRLSRGNTDDPEAPEARYFVIHDTSTPNLKDEHFPSDIDEDHEINRLNRYVAEKKAHIFLNRKGEIYVAHPLSVPWRATRLETKKVGTLARGMFIHLENVQRGEGIPSRTMERRLKSASLGFNMIASRYCI